MFSWNNDNFVGGVFVGEQLLFKGKPSPFLEEGRAGGGGVGGAA